MLKKTVVAPSKDIRPASAKTFVAVGPKVMRDNQLICGAVSNSFARRIANALNAYTPDRRGL